MATKKSTSVQLQRPALNTPVHYVSHGSPNGEYVSECRAAIVVGVPAITRAPSSRGVDLLVLNPSGVFFNRCLQDEVDRVGGTWHYDCQAVATPPANTVGAAAAAA